MTSPEPRPARPVPTVGTGMPATIRLETFAVHVQQAFGSWPYLVGSAAMGKRWRDVDLRLILDDDHFRHLFPGYAAGRQQDAMWSLICDGLSELARRLSGLPVDFQIQSMKIAARFDGHIRIPLVRLPSPGWTEQTAGNGDGPPPVSGGPSSGQNSPSGPVIAEA